MIWTASGITSTAVMLDCGFSVRQTEQRLARLDMRPENLRGIVVTHEHHDHIGGVFRFARKYQTPVWMTQGTWQAARHKYDDLALHFCADGQQIAIGDLELLPYAVPHDAREPVQYVASDGCYRLGVLTDAGHATSGMLQMLSGCDALVLECNHDRQMLADSHYPAALKSRVGGPVGHLSNQKAGQILAALDQSRLRKVVGAHLSRHNNVPELALRALQMALRSDQTEVLLACQQIGFGWQDICSQ